MKTYTLTFTEQELQILGNGLSFRPFNEVAALMRKIEQQLYEQQNPPVEPEKAA